jgi:hypothetical protein
MIFQGIRCFLGDTKTVSEVALMPAPALRLSDRQFKAVKAKANDYVLSDGDGLRLRVRSNGSMLWNFNYRDPITKNRINMGLGTYPELSLANARKKVVEARELLAQGNFRKRRCFQVRNTCSVSDRQMSSAYAGGDGVLLQLKPSGSNVLECVFCLRSLGFVLNVALHLGIYRYHLMSFRSSC